jgi:hypothetical protein
MKLINKYDKEQRLANKLWDGEFKANKGRYFKCSLRQHTTSWLKAIETYNGICEICNDNVGDQIHLDHNHYQEKNNFRGWICSICNMTLGHYEKFLLDSGLMEYYNLTTK